MSESGIEPYAIGICNASVCAPKDVPIDDILDEMNRRHPTGLAWGWAIALEENFHTGQPNPCPCERDPDKLHRLLHC